MSNTMKVGPMAIRPEVKGGVKTGRWFLDIPGRLWPSGKRKRKLFDNKTQAVKKARFILRSIENREFGSNQQPTSGFTLLQASGDWLASERLRVRTRKKKQSSLDADMIRLGSIEAFMGDKDLARIDDQTLAEYQAHRLEMGRKPATVNTEMRTIFLVLRWALKAKLITALPIVEAVGEQPKVVEVPTREELRQLVAAADPSVRALVRLLVESGIRAGEAFNLTWDCVNEVEGWIEIKPQGEWTPKTLSSMRRLPIGPELIAELRALPREGLYVFPSRYDPDRPKDNIRRSLKSAVKRAGLMRNGVLMKVTPHVLRKAFATHQANAGTPPRVLQALMGHAAGTRVTDKHYVQVTEEAKNAAMAETRLPTVANAA